MQITPNGWLDSLNQNAKWSITMVIRGVLILFAVIFFVLILKWTGLIRQLADIPEEIRIKQKSVENTSKPSTPTFSDDLTEINNLKKKLKDKIKESK